MLGIREKTGSQGNELGTNGSYRPTRGDRRTGVVVGQVMRFCRQEPVGLDSIRICALYEHLGCQEAEALIARAIEDISLHLYHVQVAYHASQLEKIAQSAKAIGFASSQIGLETLEVIAKNLRDCAKGHDRVALSAAYARLMRNGERALDLVWDMQGPIR